MYAKKWLYHSAFGLVPAGALALGAQAQTSDPAPQQDIHQDKKDIRQDKRNLR